MKLEKGVISSSQLMLLIISFIQGAHLTMGFISGIIKHDIWLVVLAALLISVPFILIYVTLAQRFPGKNLVQINDSVYGHYLGKFISVLYILFFLTVAAQNLIFVGYFLTTFIIPETPIWIIIIMFAFVCSWAVRNGIEVIARCTFLFVIITAAAVLLVTLLLLKDMEFTNFLPIFEVSLKDFVQGVHVVSTISFCEIVVFLMVIPYTNKIKQAKNSILLGLILGAAQLFIIVVRDTAVLGILESVMASPSFEVVRLIDIAHIITRLDILIAIVLLVTMFMKVSIFYYATVLGIAQLFKLRSYVPMVLPIGVIIISYAVLASGSSAEYNYIAAHVWPMAALPLEFIIPPLTLLTAKIRRLPKKQGGEQR